MKSIISNEKECLICHTTRNLNRHHIYAGSANRRKSEADGCWCYLCIEHHTGAHGVHQNRSLDVRLKQDCQRIWESLNGGRDAFIKRYGKSWILEDI